MDFLKNWIRDNLLRMDSNISNITNILNEDFLNPGSAWYQFAMDIKAIVQPIALTIIIICFLIEFLKITIQMDILKWEYALKVIFKLVFAKVCMDGAYYFLGAIYTTSVDWISRTGALAANVGEQTWLQIKDELDNYGMLALLALFISTGIVFIAIWAISLVIQIMAYARKFELTIYLAIAPLPCAFLPLEDGGTSRIPKKYVSAFASVCLQGLFMIMAVKLYSVLCNEVVANAITNSGDISGAIGQLFIGVCVLMIAIMKSSSWAKSILDVQ